MRFRRRSDSGRSAGAKESAGVAHLDRAIDAVRRRGRFETVENIERHKENAPCAAAMIDDTGFEDDRLRLIFTCCHPALPPLAQVALTLREVCGLTTEQIASAFLTPAPTLAQRVRRLHAPIFRAKRSVSSGCWSNCCPSRKRLDSSL